MVEAKNRWCEVPPAKFWILMAKNSNDGLCAGNFYDSNLGILLMAKCQTESSVCKLANVKDAVSTAFRRSSGERTRTSTGILPLDFESSASANSATPPEIFLDRVGIPGWMMKTRFYWIGSLLFKVLKRRNVPKWACFWIQIENISAVALTSLFNSA